MAKARKRQVPNGYIKKTYDLHRTQVEFLEKRARQKSREMQQPITPTDVVRELIRRAQHPEQVGS